MPYVSDIQRNSVEDLLDGLVNEIRALPLEQRGGMLNYLFCRLSMQTLKPDSGWGYTSLAEIIKHLEAAKLEIYRRCIAPYEGLAIKRNGDVPEFVALEQEIFEKLKGLS